MNINELLQKNKIAAATTKTNVLIQVKISVLEKTFKAKAVTKSETKKKVEHKAYKWLYKKLSKHQRTVK